MTKSNGGNIPKQSEESVMVMVFDDCTLVLIIIIINKTFHVNLPFI